MYNILVTGAAGQLGTCIADCRDDKQGDRYFFVSKQVVDIADLEALFSYCQKHQIDVIINCAAYTKVDQAESEVELAYSINQEGAKNVAIVAKKLACKLIHISTDYVFEGKGTTAFKEDGFTDPVTVYGKSKLAGELEIKEVNPSNSLIIRTSWLYSEYGSNFLLTMLRLAREKKLISVVDDQHGCPTYAKDLATVILGIIPVLSADNVKVYHFSNKNPTTWYFFAEKIIKTVSDDLKLVPIKTSAFITVAKRPVYSVLDCTRIKKDFAVTIRSWEIALEECLANLWRSS